MGGGGDVGDVGDVGDLVLVLVAVFVAKIFFKRSPCSSDSNSFFLILDRRGV